MTRTAIGGAEKAFDTSGHTANPVRWIRSLEQMQQEVELVTATALGPIDHVVTFAPDAHLYGYLFGSVLPTLLDVSVEDLSGDPLAAPRFRPGIRTLYVCLPASWRLLRAATAAQGDLTGSIGLHGAGPVTAGVAQTAQEMARRGLTVVELFGSTETGGIGYRPMTADAAEPWRLLPDVDLVDDVGPGEPRLLQVRSPRIARRADQSVALQTHELTDVIRPLGNRRFAFLGRSTRLVKINGARWDLAAIEELIAETTPGIDPVCVAVRDELRGEHYELFYVDGRRAATSWMSAALHGLPQPRAVHRVSHIPRTVTGKVELNHLLTMREQVRIR